RSAARGCSVVSGLSCLGGRHRRSLGRPCGAHPVCSPGSRRMAEAPELPADPLTSLPPRAEVVQPDPARSRLPRVGVVLAAGQAERLAFVPGGGCKALAPTG